jgi:diguanylate cyclase (GGDEF)-like protein/PAS domain S-box-containing protein
MSPLPTLKKSDGSTIVIDPSKQGTLHNLLRSLVMELRNFPTPVVWMILGVTATVLVSRSLSLLQGIELQVIDQYFRMRPPEPLDPRIVIVEINDDDIRRNERWPLSDAQMTNLLERLKQSNPRAIGLDIYRDFPVVPGTLQFNKTLTETPNIISVEQLTDGKTADSTQSRTSSKSMSKNNNVLIGPPPAVTDAQRIGFNNIILDEDQKVRRAFLYWNNDRGGSPKESFSLKLAKIYLAKNQIHTQPAPDRASDLKLGRGIFRQVQPDTGVYVRTDAGSYQVLVNFRGGPTPFQVVPMQSILDGAVPSETIRDRIVIIGSTASSLKDFVATPYTHKRPNGNTWMSGVELQAQFVSQIVAAALDGRPLLQSWSEGGEILWIGLWSGLGVLLCSQRYGSRRSILGIAGMSGTVVVCGYGAFSLGWVVPVVAPIVGLVSALALVTTLNAHAEEELARSKEFLNRIINTIPDPIFVKDKYQHWVVLNEAYARFVGASLEELIGKTAHDVFPQHEADLFVTRDEETFLQEREREDEEVLTDLFGEVHYIATKRSLHRDGGGNVFLVGVIRDITVRKTREEALERAKQELSESNEELRQSQSRLHYLANHDPLTGLPNRALFREKLQEAMAWADQTHRVIALLFIDLDGFKQVNDTLGHGVGDQLLKSVAKRLVSCLRASDTVARMGGDEFTVILLGSLQVQQVERVATKVLQTLSQPFTFDGHRVCISGSVGISLYPDPCDTLETMIETADAAMYRAKQSGKNRYAIG